jgi:hypothetical protein
MESFINTSNTSLPTFNEALLASAPLYSDQWTQVATPLTWCTLLAVSLFTALRVTKASVSSTLRSETHYFTLDAQNKAPNHPPIVSLSVSIITKIDLLLRIPQELTYTHLERRYLRESRRSIRSSAEEARFSYRCPP